MSFLIFDREDGFGSATFSGLIEMNANGPDGPGGEGTAFGLPEKSRPESQNKKEADGPVQERHQHQRPVYERGPNSQPAEKKRVGHEQRDESEVESNDPSGDDGEAGAHESGLGPTDSGSSEVIGKGVL